MDIFQFTPLREGRRVVRRVCGLVLRISIHAPPRGATCWKSEKRLPMHFNSRPSARGDSAPHDCCAACTISIHAPPRGATAVVAVAVCARKHFNSRPSARGDTVLGQRRRTRTISIHAPPRGATFADSANAERLVISIHAPPRGATAGGGTGRTEDEISIHAPPRGATTRVGKSYVVNPFQFTPLREGRR